VPEHVVHWDEVEPFRADEGAFRSTWTNLGRAAGTITVGVNRVQVDPGARSTPLHMEGAEEEIFFVLAGSGLSWQDDGDGEKTYEIGAGDCLVHLAGAEAHSVVAGREGIDYLVFGTRAKAEYAFFPRLKAGRMGMLWAGMIETHQWKQEDALGDPELPEPSPRPRGIVNIDEVEEEDWGRRDVLVHGRDLGIAAGSVLTGINYNRIEPGMLSAPPHCHSVEEEIFVILDGTASVSHDGEVVAELGPDDFFGEIGLLESERRTATVTATSPLRAIVMFGPHFRSMEREMPELAQQIRTAIRERINR